MNLSLSLSLTSLSSSSLTLLYSVVQVCWYKRLSPLVPLDNSLEGDLRNVTDGDCVVVFSREKLFRVRRSIERATNKPCAIIYGGLPSGKILQ